MAHYRIIQRARQQAHRSLASPALALLNMTGHTDLDQDHNAALITAAYLIRCASIEQLAVAIPVAIREISTNNYWPISVRFPEFSEIAACLLSLDNNTLSLERRIAIRTALQLSTIVSRKQIHQSVRRSRAHMTSPRANKHPGLEGRQLQKACSELQNRRGGFPISSCNESTIILTFALRELLYVL